MGRWEMYHSIVGDEPNTLAVNALKYTKSRGCALDIGAGNLRDSHFLRREGFKRVVAVDASVDSLDYEDGDINVELHIKRVQDFEFSTNLFDLVLCCNVLFFLDTAEINDVLKKVHRSLRPNCIFACNVLGIKDRLFGDEDRGAKYSIHNIAELTKDFGVLTVKEDESEFGRSITWDVDSPTRPIHIWSLLLRKP